MLSKTSRKDVAKDKASELVSAATDAAEAGRDKLAPVVENVTGHLSDAAGAAAPHVARAKETVVESAAPHVAKAKEAAAEAAAPKVEKAKKETRKQAEEAADAAAPKVAKAKKQTRKQAKKARKAARKAAESAAPSVEQVKDSAVLSSEQARRLFNEEWMPRVHEAIAAAGAAGTTAYAALPDRARDTVEAVAPEVVKKRRKKGKVLIALGLLAGAGAVALYLSGQNKGGAKQVTPAELPEVERRNVQDVEAATVSGSDDAVGDLEAKVDSSVSGSRRGRHAAKE